MGKFSVTVLGSDVLLAGDVDVDSVPQFRKALALAADPLVVDLRGVTFMSSAGLHVLLDCADRGLTVSVVAGSVLSRLMDIVRLGQVVTVIYSDASPG